jgi:thioester reductase-like protein
MIADAVLADDIRPDLARLDSAPLTRHARAVLLTGATGFVGAHLVGALASESAADIYCLVRPKLGDTRERLRDHLTRYGVWSESLESRLHVVEGDLTLPRFGM